MLKFCLWNQVVKYQLNFKYLISLFAYLGKLGVISSQFVILSLLEFPSLSSIHSEK